MLDEPTTKMLRPLSLSFLTCALSLSSLLIILLQVWSVARKYVFNPSKVRFLTFLYRFYPSTKSHNTPKCHVPVRSYFSPFLLAAQTDARERPPAWGRRAQRGVCPGDFGARAGVEEQPRPRERELVIGDQTRAGAWGSAA
jgi:hypothetical protein